MDKCAELRQGNVESGKDYTITCVVDEKGLNDAIGIEMVVTYTNVEGKEYIYCVAPMEMVKREGDLYTFQVTHSLSNAGSFKVAYRMFLNIQNCHIVRTSAMFVGSMNKMTYFIS